MAIDKNAVINLTGDLSYTATLSCDIHISQDNNIAFIEVIFEVISSKYQGEIKNFNIRTDAFIYDKYNELLDEASFEYCSLTSSTASYNFEIDVSNTNILRFQVGGVYYDEDTGIVYCNGYEDFELQLDFSNNINLWIKDSFGQWQNAQSIFTKIDDSTWSSVKNITQILEN